MKITSIADKAYKETVKQFNLESGDLDPKSVADFEQAVLNMATNLFKANATKLQFKGDAETDPTYYKVEEFEKTFAVVIESKVEFYINSAGTGKQEFYIEIIDKNEFREV